MTNSSTLRVGILALAAAFFAPLTIDAQANVGIEGTYHIHGGTVVVGDGQVLEGATVLLQDGMIAAVGPNVPAPAGAIHIDASGLFVYAGMIDSYTPIGLNEIGRIATMNMSSELGEFNPHMRALVAINTGSEMLGITRANGVLSAITAPSGGIISGQAALIHMDGWTWEDMEVRGNAGYVLNYPSAGGGGRGFGRRGGGGGGAAARAARVAEQLTDLKSELDMARAYNLAREQGLEDEDLVYEAMRPLMNGDVPLLANVNSEDDIRGAMELAEQFGLELVIHGGRDAWKLRNELADAGVPVVLANLTSNPGQNMPYDHIYAQPGILVEAGVKVAFSSGSHSKARHLPYEAALATAYGMSLEDAWKAVTVWPAEIWGVSDLLGTVEVGKIGNVFVGTGDPLDIRNTPTHLFIKGRLVPADDRSTRLYEKHNARPMRGGNGN